LIDPPRHGRLRLGAGGAFAAGGLLAFAAALSGCVETTAEVAPTEAHQQFVRRPGANLAGASVAFVSVDGPSSAISANFMQILAREAAAHDIAVVDPKKARYLVRGYLSAYGGDNGAAVEYVWDVFTKDRQRTQRVNDVIDTKGENPWREEALTSIAANSAEDLAAYLSNTPEASASAEPAAPQAKPMSYAAN
jgi:hypothetical protein